MTETPDAKIRAAICELVEASPPPPPFQFHEPSALPSRPTRRRFLAVAVALLVIAGSGLLAIARRDRAGVAGRPHGNEFVVDDGSIEVVDADTGAIRASRPALPHRRGGDDTYALVATGGYLAYPGDGGTWAMPDDLRGTARFLGPSTYEVPSGVAGRVWLVTTNVNGVPLPIATAREVSVDGRYRGTLRHLPIGAVVITGVQRGLLLARGDAAVMWSPASGRLGPDFPGPLVGNLVDVRGPDVAWGMGCTPFRVCSSIRVTSIDSGRHRDFPAPAGTAGWLPTGAGASRDSFSPDGRRLVVRGATGPSDAGPSAVYVVELASGTATRIPGSGGAAYLPVAWSGDGTSVVYEDDRIEVFQPGTGRLRHVTHRCCARVLLGLHG